MDRPPDQVTDRPLDRLSDDERSQWVTFQELAQARGISRASASKLVRRKRWRRQADNESRVRILVPLDELRPEADRAPDSPTPDTADKAGDNPADTTGYAQAFETALKAVEATHERHVADLREAHAREVAGLRDQVQRERENAGQFAGLLRDAEARFKLELAAADGRAQEAGARADRAEARADALRNRIDGLLAPAPPESDPAQGAAAGAPQGEGAAPAPTPPESADPPQAHAPGVRRGWFSRLLGRG